MDSTKAPVIHAGGIHGIMAIPMICKQTLTAGVTQQSNSVDRCDSHERLASGSPEARQELQSALHEMKTTALAVGLLGLRLTDSEGEYEDTISPEPTCPIKDALGCQVARCVIIPELSQGMGTVCQDNAYKWSSVNDHHTFAAHGRHCYW